MTTPYIMPLGFIDRPTETGATFILSNPEDSHLLKPGTPVTLWQYSPGQLALAKVRGEITDVGFVTATLTTVESQTDPRWPEDREIICPKTPVYLALPDSFEPDTSRTLSQEQVEAIRSFALQYREITGDQHPKLTQNGDRKKTT